MNDAKFIIQICKGLIRHARTRRLLMFYSVILALVMLFGGAVLQWPSSHEHPLLFLVYWAACAWITFLAVLLALYDMVKVRADGKRARRMLERQYFEKSGDDAKPR